jgi:ATP-binding cassette subfamily C protein CydD
VRRVSLAYRDRTLSTLRYAFLSGLVLEFITAGAIALVAVSLGLRLLAGDIGFERAFFVLLLTPEFYRPLRELGQHRHAAMEARAPAERIGALLGQEATAPATPEPAADIAMRFGPSLRRRSAGANRSVPPREPAIRLAGPLRVACRAVTYVYQGSAQPTVDGVNLILEPGRRTALVGRSGAGKTTLLYLLLRFIEPTAGAIEVNGIAIDSLAPETWRAHLAYVPQRPHLFAGSIGENISLGRPDAGMGAVVAAATLAGADRFVERLPRGYDTTIGERGLRLAGGEMQRISLARAFLKDAPVLLLDEPTSHLDPASEALIRGALERLMEGRTVLIAAHRLNTIYSADRIVVLEGGKVVEQGPHSDLAARGGLYARMVGERPLVAR